MVTYRPGPWVWIVFACLAAGCRGGDPGDLPSGCSSGDEVPPPIRADLEAGARKLYERARRGAWAAIYEGAAEAVRTRNTQDAFVTPIARTLREMGLPDGFETESVAVVRFGPEFPARNRVECRDAGAGPGLTLLLTDFPAQASLVQKGNLGREAVYFSTLWHREGSAWRLAGFFAKPATLVGADWEHYAARAAAEFEAKRLRNAALLYNVAIDLVVPNAWTKPGEIGELEEKQRHISVSALPRGAPDGWPAPPDTFRVHQVNYGLARGDLCLLVRYEAVSDLADTLALAARSDVLHRYVEAAFPEYPQVFPLLAMVAFDPRAPERSWSRIVPLRRPS